MANMFNVLYHRYIDQIKQQQIQTYNRKHKQYLKRINNNENSYYESNKYQSKPKPLKKTNRQIKPQQIDRNLSTNMSASISTNVSANVSTKVNTIINTSNNQSEPRRKRQFKNNGATKTPNEQQQSSTFNEQPIRTQYNKDKKFQQAQAPYQSNHPAKSNEYQQRQIKPLTNIIQKPIKPAQINQFSMENQFPQQDSQNIVLEQCPEGCGRKFRSQALQKHVKVCQKIFQAKRKQFKVDVVDDQAKNMAKKSTLKSQKAKPKPASKVPKWKKQSQMLRNGLKSTKDDGNAPSAPVQEQDDRVQCGGCGRKFNQTAADKHIPSCIARNKKR